MSLKFDPKVPINSISSLVQIIAWHRPGDKPLSEPMMASLLTHICITRPQWVLTSYFFSEFVIVTWEVWSIHMTDRSKLFFGKFYLLLLHLYDELLVINNWWMLISITSISSCLHAAVDSTTFRVYEWLLPPAWFRKRHEMPDKII